MKKFGSKVTSPSIDELSNLLLINPSFIFILFSLTNLNVKKLLNISKLSNPLIFPNWSVVNKTFVDTSSSGISSVKLFLFFNLLFNSIKILLFKKFPSMTNFFFLLV